MKQKKIEPIRTGLETALYHALQLAKFPRIKSHYLTLIYSNQKLSIGNKLNAHANSVKIA